MGKVSSKKIIMITGAAGFVGRFTVACASSLGIVVHALVRNKDSVPTTWNNDKNIRVFIADIAEQESRKVVQAALNGAGAVIHLAAALGGDRRLQVRNTVTATNQLLDIINAQKSNEKIKLVLASSIVVYDVDLPKGRLIDESTPIEKHPRMRDTYCQAKLEQESLVRQNSSANNLQTIILRSGIVFGPGRLMNAFLGRKIGPLILYFSAGLQIPTCYVENCAAALITAATTDRSMKRLEIFNLVDDDLPNRRQYIDALMAQGWPRITFPLPIFALRALANILRMVPVLGPKLPGLLRHKVLKSQISQFQYSNSRIKELLAWKSRWTFVQAMSRSIDQSHGLQHD